ncbi:hypothetical protein IR129_04095 [Staphylococcus lentus]|nr:hypothetical protein [Mammaliicoccus lentus]TFV17109.1 hypothetical protein E4T78_04015 [Mammaliicoccus lentus]
MCAEKYGWDFKTTNQQPYLLLLKMLNSTNDKENSPKKETNNPKQGGVITGNGLKAFFGG